MPIFVSPDSADVWANPQLFLLDADRRPTVVAGVPPDYFSQTGQLWGNPHYDWDAMRRDGFAWWVARLRATLELVDLVRLDHFRGFEASWEVPAGEPTAVNGQVGAGPGRRAVRRACGPTSAGCRSSPRTWARSPRTWTPCGTPLGLPGMQILQFAFGKPTEPVPAAQLRPPNCVVYTGTHDNDTTRGWYESLDASRARRLSAGTPPATGRTSPGT